MTLAELYDALLEHDWYADWSDDPRVRREGHEDRQRLVAAAQELGEAGRALLAEFRDYNYPYRRSLTGLPRRPS